MEEKPQPHNKSILRQILIYIPSSILPSVLTLLTTAIFTRVFSTEKYGTYSYFLSISVSVRLALSMWLMLSIGRFLAPIAAETARKAEKRSIFLGIFLLTAAYAVLSAAALIFALPWMAPEWRRFILPMSVFTVTISFFDISNSIFTAERRANEFAVFKIADSVIAFLLRLLLVFVLLKGDVTSMFWATVASNLACIPFMWAKSRLPGPAALPSVLAERENWRKLAPYLGYGLVMTVWQVFSIVLDVGDRYVLQFLRGMSEVGIYDANYRLIGGTVYLIVVPITMALHPYLMSISAGGDKGRISTVLGIIIENMLLIGTLAVGMCAVFNRDLAYVLLGPDFRAGCVIMPLVLAGTILFNVGSFAHKPFEIAMKTFPMVLTSLGAVALNMALNFILIPLVGYVGAAIATLAAYASYTLAIGLMGRRIIRWELNLRSLLPDALAIAAGSAAIWLARSFLERFAPAWAALAAALALGGALSGFYLLKIMRNLRSASSRFREA